MAMPTGEIAKTGIDPVQQAMVALRLVLNDAPGPASSSAGVALRSDIGSLEKRTQQHVDAVD
eukprot:4594553-Pyramimonas_sp.AAC.1